MPISPSATGGEKGKERVGTQTWVLSHESLNPHKFQGGDSKGFDLREKMLAIVKRQKLRLSYNIPAFHPKCKGWERAPCPRGPL